MSKVEGDTRMIAKETRIERHGDKDQRYHEMFSSIDRVIDMKLFRNTCSFSKNLLFLKKK